MDKPTELHFSYDKESDIITIEGVRYAGEFFRGLSEHGINLNVPFVITERSDSVVAISLHRERVTIEHYENSPEYNIDFLDNVTSIGIGDFTTLIIGDYVEQKDYVYVPIITNKPIVVTGYCLQDHL